MKVRIGIGLGTRTRLNTTDLGDVAVHMDARGIDSIWMSERVNSVAPDPVVALSYIAGRTTSLKLGTSVMVLPGRNPVIAAAQLASLATLSRGRLLPAVGLGAVDPAEQAAFGVRRGERARMFDEALAIMRQCWSGDTVQHTGEHYQVDGVRVGPVPERLEVWLGGIADSELRRVGRFGDGWLPSFITPADAERGRRAIESVTRAEGRSIDDDHYGVLIPFSQGTVPEPLLDTLAKRRPDLDDPRMLVPSSWPALRELIAAFVDLGTTKFVVLPVDEPSDADGWSTLVDTIADEVVILERDDA